MKKTIIIIFSLLLSTVSIYAQTWEFVGLDSMLIKQIYVSGDTIWAGTDARINPNMIAGLYKSTDGGNIWNQIDSTLGDGTSVFFHKNLNNSIYYLVKGTGSFNIAGYLHKSTDQGNNWEIIQQLENIAIDWIGVSPFDENEIYVKESHFIPAGWFETVYRTIDAGSNWEEITSGFPASSHGRLMSFNLSLTDSSTLYASDNNNLGSTYFFKSTDKGDNWSYTSSPPSVGQELIANPSTPERIFIFPGYYLSGDGGYAWRIADSCFINPSSYLSFYVDPVDKTILYSLRMDGLYKTKNDTICWQLIDGSDDLPLNIGSYGFIYEDIGQLRNVFIDLTTNEIYVGTAKGVYKKDLITSIKENENNKLSEYILQQNYPNPFNPITTISYYIPQQSYITIKVYDIIGNEIITLVKGEEKAGNYQVKFDGTYFSSGVYFYILTANTENGKRIREGKKMLMLK